jgi:hypothetical protein
MGPFLDYKVLLYILAASLLCSCKKSSINPQYSFTDSTYLGVYTYTTGDTIYFQSNAPASSKFLWSFGDGTTSGDAQPKHVYYQRGTMNATLTVNGDINFSWYAICCGMHKCNAAVCTKPLQYMPPFQDSKFES